MAILRKVVRWASIVCKSRVAPLILWWWFPERPSSEEPTIFALCCLAVAEIVIPWLVCKIKPIQCIAVPILSARLLHRIWVLARRFFSPVDLQKLCDSHHDEGEIGLPRELIDKIMRHNDLQTLESCSLTSKAFYSAARPLIHRRLVLRSMFPGPHVPRDPTLEKANVRYAHYLSATEKLGLLRYGYVRELDLDLSFGKSEDVLQLKQLRALETVHTLTIRSLPLHEVLPIFDRCLSQFVPTLRSLSLKETRCENAHKLMEFVCRFPHLDDLELTDPCGPKHEHGLAVAPGSKGPQPQQPLPFGGRLVLQGFGPLVQSLLDLPGGIRFHTIEARSHLKDLAKLLVTCSSTLEVLSIRCFDNLRLQNHRLRELPYDEMLSVNLRSNGALRRFELVVDFAELDILPPFVLKTLGSISSPHFSEFSLRLLRGLSLKEDAGCRETLWGAGWEAVDEDLYARTAQSGGFRFAIKIVTGESTEAAVEAIFPRMKSKGSLFIAQKQPRKWWLK